MNYYVNKLEEKTTNVNKQKASEEAIQFKNNRENSTQINSFKNNINTSSKTIAQRAKADTINNSPIQRQENKTGLPDQLKSGIESLSGLDMSDTKVHYNSSKPAQLQAHAYAQGNNIHLASGQEKHLPHEAWHVVQQKQGRVQATTQLKGKTPVNDDPVLEHEADVMGAKALQSSTLNTINSTFQHKKISNNVTQGFFIKKDKKDGITYMMTTGYLKQEKANNGLDSLSSLDWKYVDKLVDFTNYSKTFVMDETGKFDAEIVKQKCYEIAMAIKFANEIDQGNLVAFGDKHGVFADFEFAQLVSKIATKKSTLLLEAPDISIKEMEEWGKGAADTRNIAKLGKTINNDEGWDVKGIDALHPNGGGYLKGNKKYLKDYEREGTYGKEKPYPEAALGPGRRIGPLRQKYIAKQLTKAIQKGGCLLVIGTTHIKGKTGRDTYTVNDVKKQRKKYTTPSLHELLTKHKGQITKVKMTRNTYYVQVIKKGMIQ
ncbi:eCIS core domain-containing protein [Tenacibaculum salmonis]|uniref:eCIS core domain-containing protein n=1 Tax=Tenacibaculum sp. P3-BQ1 TaxID=3232310 RepID=UPI0034DF35D7